MLEDYLMAVTIQHENPKLILEKTFSILQDYKFENDSYQKITDHLVDFCKENIKFNARNFLKILPKELAPSFDASYLFPLEENEEKQEYIGKAAKDLMEFFSKKKLILKGS